MIYAIDYRTQINQEKLQIIRICMNKKLCDHVISLKLKAKQYIFQSQMS